mgnify:FL=1
MEKKFALNNSYFKNRRPDDPFTIAEITAYHMEHGELPFRYDGDNWPYDTVCERQKKHSVQYCQYLTPELLASRIAGLARKYAGENIEALDACCGTGQITKHLLKLGFTVSAFDIDPGMTQLHNYFYPDCYASIADFRTLDGMQWPLIVSNPPFDRGIAEEFIRWLVESLSPGGIAVLLLPLGFVDKQRPKTLIQDLFRLRVLHRCTVTDKFAHTNGVFEIVVFENRMRYDGK